MRKSLFILLLFGVGQISNAQNLSPCYTEAGYTSQDTLDIPWYGNNEMLYRILEDHQDVLVEPNAIRSGSDCNDINSALVIPVKF